MVSKGQAAAEMIIILSVGLTILLTIMVVNNKLITGTEGKIEATKARNAVDSLADSAELVYQQGVGSRTRVFVALPDEIQSFTASGQAIAMQLYAGGNIRDVYRSLDFNVSGTLATEEGDSWFYAESKQGSVEFSQNITEALPDETPPASATNLNNQSQGTAWIYWNWTNPADADFSKSIVYLDSVWKINTSDNFYNATGLTSNTSYTITVHTKDTNGNVNDTDANDTAETLGAAETMQIYLVVSGSDVSDGSAAVFSGGDISKLAADDTDLITSDANWPKNNLGYDEGKYIEFNYSPNISASSILSVTIINVYQKKADRDIAAKLEIWDQSASLWINETLVTPSAKNTDQTEVINVSSYITTAEDINNIKIRFLTYVIPNKNVKTKQDYVAVNVTYTP